MPRWRRTLTALAVGAAAAYFMDPSSGQARRSRLKGRVARIQAVAGVRGMRTERLPA